MCQVTRRCRALCIECSINKVFQKADTDTQTLGRRDYSVTQGPIQLNARAP